MTSAVIVTRFGFLAGLIGIGAVSIADVQAQTNGAARSESEEVDVQPVDRGKFRLELLLKLVGNELRAASENKAKLVTEQINLVEERAELAAIGNERRPADEVRLEQIEARLETIGEELGAIDKKLPEIVAEADELQRRLDEANGIVRDDTETASNAAGENGATTDEQSSASLWLDRNRQVQEALVYLGGYNALIDGDFGPRTAQAVRIYQGSQSFETTGVLTEEQKVGLLEQAAAQRSLYGVTTLEDGEAGYRLSYPSYLLSQREEGSGAERRLTTKDGEGELIISVIEGTGNLDQLYAAATENYEVQYRRKRGDWFVVAGLVDNDRIVYDTVRTAENTLIRARLSYPAEKRDLWSPFAVIMFNTFSPIPTS